MTSNLIGAALTFLIGIGIGAANYALSRYILLKKPGQYAMTMMARQFVQIAYIVLVFVLGPFTPWDRIWMLVGAVLGITLAMFWSTFKLVKLNDSIVRKEEKSDG